MPPPHRSAISIRFRIAFIQVCFVAAQRQKLTLARARLTLRFGEFFRLMYGVIQKSKARRFLMTSASEGKSAPGGLGANRRTAKYVGGGAAVGAVLGAILGGGKGAAIGGLVGGAGGAGAQGYTGRKKEIPPETELKYKLAQDSSFDL